MKAVRVRYSCNKSQTLKHFFVPMTEGNYLFYDTHLAIEHLIRYCAVNEVNTKYNKAQPKPSEYGKSKNIMWKTCLLIKCQKMYKQMR